MAIIKISPCVDSKTFSNGKCPDIVGDESGASYRLSHTDGTNCCYTMIPFAGSRRKKRCPVIILSPSTLPNGTIGVPYNQTITASPSASPHSFAVIAGTPPTGLTLGANGNLSGTPTTEGDFTFTVQATDLRGCRGAIIYTIHIFGTPP